MARKLDDWEEESIAEIKCIVEQCFDAIYSVSHIGEDGICEPLDLSALREVSRSVDEAMLAIESATNLSQDEIFEILVEDSYTRLDEVAIRLHQKSPYGCLVNPRLSAVVETRL